MVNNSSIISGYTENVVCGPKYNEDGLTREGGVNIPGVIGLFIFYVVVLIVGIISSRKYTGKWFTSNSTEHIVAGRNISLSLGILTVIATSVGGGFINGTAEQVYAPGFGVVWTQAPFLYTLSVALGGLLFAKKMRVGKYFSVADPLQEKYGHLFTTMAYISICTSNLLWTASILSALGSTLSVIIGLNHQWAIITSAMIAVIYTISGGLASVIYTDVIQLIIITCGLVSIQLLMYGNITRYVVTPLIESGQFNMLLNQWLCIPFALMHEAVSPIKDTAWGNDGWIGTLSPDVSLGIYIDSALMILLGGTTWNCLYQRVLSQKNDRKAQIMCYASCVATMFFIIPPVLIGAIGKSTEWNATDFRESGCLPMRQADYKMILPFVLFYLTPFTVAIIGLGAVSAGVMSSCDSAILSTASMFAVNIYRPCRNYILHQMGKSKDGDRDILFVLRAAICFFALISTSIAIFVHSIYGLLIISADLNYVFIFPQLVSMMYIDHSNSYGAIISGVFAFFVRVSAGEPILNLSPVFRYPWYDEATEIQYFPFRTVGMFLTFGMNISISYMVENLFIKWKIVPMRFDVFGCFMIKTKEKNREQELEQLNT